jgi:SAM-dependent methyltransferase
LACGRSPATYYRYWKIKPDRFIRIDSSRSVEPDIVADLNNSIPLRGNFADNVFLFNAFYMIEDPEKLLSEIYRVLKSEGRVFMTAQFIKAEESHVSDLYRYGSRRLREMFSAVGFNEIRIIPIGARFCALANLGDFVLGSNFFLMNFIKVFIRLFCLFADQVMLQKLEQSYPCPIAWFVVAQK